MDTDEVFIRRTPATMDSFRAGEDEAIVAKILAKEIIPRITIRIIYVYIRDEYIVFFKFDKHCHLATIIQLITT